MKILEVSPDILKDLIFDHLFIEANKNKYSEDFFSFKWNDDQSSIIYEDIDFVVDGNSCWEDSEQTEKHTCAHRFNYSEIGEFFNGFLVQEYKIHQQYEKNITDIYIDYLDNHKSEYDYWHFISEDTRQEDEDCYYNYNRVRTLTINVDDILTHLKKLHFFKELNEAKSVFHNLDTQNLDILVRFDHLNNKLPEKNITSKKLKI